MAEGEWDGRWERKSVTVWDYNKERGLKRLQEYLQQGFTVVNIFDDHEHSRVLYKLRRPRNQPPQQALTHESA